MVSIKPSQIIYLEHIDARLYAEAIQLAGAHRIWARPMMLVRGLPNEPYFRQQAIATAAADLENSSLDLYDLKGAPDLVWPAQSFQIAFDVDVFSLLFYLTISEASIDSDQVLAQFNQFLRASWNQSTQTAEPQSKELLGR